VGLNIRLEKLTPDEIRYLVHLDAVSDEGRRIESRAAEVMMRQHGKAPAGRWQPLTWYASRERIMPKSELKRLLAEDREH
jgi:hypothetical protein